jgi:5-keto 4-deoxyuronate isomerase
MKSDMRWSMDPRGARTLDTAGLRDNFLIETLFETGEIHLTYSHEDRMVIGGASPAAYPLKLEPMKTFGTDSFFARREAVFANIGEAGEVTVDGTVHKLGHRDMLYVGRGAGDVLFSGAGAKFYIVSAPAHATHPVTLVRISDANRVDLGSQETSNERSIFQFVHAKGVSGKCINDCWTAVAVGQRAPVNSARLRTGSVELDRETQCSCPLLPTKSCVAWENGRGSFIWTRPTSPPDQGGAPLRTV